MTMIKTTTLLSIPYIINYSGVEINYRYIYDQTDASSTACENNNNSVVVPLSLYNTEFTMVHTCSMTNVSFDWNMTKESILSNIDAVFFPNGKGNCSCL